MDTDSLHEWQDLYVGDYAAPLISVIDDHPDFCSCMCNNQVIYHDPHVYQPSVAAPFPWI